MEIERKFKVKELPDLTERDCVLIEQAYIAVSPVIRIRKKETVLADGSIGSAKYILTIKSGGMMAHEEYELEMTAEEYETLTKKVEGNIITKRRYLLPLDDGLTVELDIFEGAFDGLVIAEIEFPDEKTAESYIPPEYFGEDVTFDGRYHNNKLSLMTSAEIRDLLGQQ